MTSDAASIPGPALNGMCLQDAKELSHANIRRPARPAENQLARIPATNERRVVAAYHRVERTNRAATFRTAGGGKTSLAV
jgi:hypothetical protein